MTKQRTRTPVNAQRYHSPRDEAERLSVSETLVLEACRAGTYPHRRFGRRILINPEEADAYHARSGVTVEQALASTRESSP